MGEFAINLIQTALQYSGKPQTINPATQYLVFRASSMGLIKTWLAVEVLQRRFEALLLAGILWLNATY
jgi:hypothetical protein